VLADQVDATWRADDADLIGRVTRWRCQLSKPLEECGPPFMNCQTSAIATGIPFYGSGCRSVVGPSMTGAPFSNATGSMRRLRMPFG